MKNNFNTLRQYLYDNSANECTKETLEGLFRAILEPLFSNQKYECTVLIRLNNLNNKQSILPRLSFSGADIFYFNGVENQKSNLWDKTEFLIVLGQRYSAALIWDYDIAEKPDYAKYVFGYNSKYINDIVKKISDNSKVEFKHYVPDRRENLLLYQSVNKLASTLNDKTEEILFNQKHIENTDDTIVTAQIVADKARFIAHEIKNSLSVINLYSTITKKRLSSLKGDDEAIQSVENAIKCIINASENISAQISDLRCISTPYIVEVNIKKLIENTVDMCRKKADDAGVNIYIEDIKDYIIQTDKTKFECALTNIIYNAIEACAKGCKIQINPKKETDFIKIYVKNDGDKIPDEIKEKIFEENFTTKEKGNGLGLAICKKQLELTGGNINLVTSDDKETIFEIVLPL